MRTWWRLGVSGVVLAAAVLVGGAARAAVETCEQYGTVSVDGGRYIVQNSRWGAGTAQCISVDGASFRITRADHNNATNGPPASYPSIYAGCHYGNCTTGSGLPVRVRDLGNPRATLRRSPTTRWPAGRSTRPGS